MSALFRAQLSCVGVMAVAYIGCGVAALYSRSPERIMALCVGGAALADFCIYLAYRHHLKQKRNNRGHCSGEVSPHG